MHTSMHQCVNMFLHGYQGVGATCTPDLGLVCPICTLIILLSLMVFPESVMILGWFGPFHGQLDYVRLHSQSIFRVSRVDFFLLAPRLQPLACPMCHPPAVSQSTREADAQVKFMSPHLPVIRHVKGTVGDASTNARMLEKLPQNM